jgi:hypothetical protein
MGRAVGVLSLLSSEAEVSSGADGTPSDSWVSVMGCHWSCYPSESEHLDSATRIGSQSELQHFPLQRVERDAESAGGVRLVVAGRSKRRFDVLSSQVAGALPLSRSAVVCHDSFRLDGGLRPTAKCNGPGDEVLSEVLEAEEEASTFAGFPEVVSDALRDRLYGGLELTHLAGPGLFHEECECLL